MEYRNRVIETVIDSWDGKILLEYMKNKLKLSRRMIIRLKQSEAGIELNGESVTVRAKLRTGDEISLRMEDDGENINENILPVNLPLHIVYEDEDIIGLEKPYGMVTHISHGHYEDSLSNAVAYYYERCGKPFVFRAVNRLDRDTSGLVLMAKNQRAAYIMSLELQRGEIEKKYIAILRGKIEPCEGTIETFIRRESGSIIKRENAEEGKASEYAKTRYRVIWEGEGKSVVECEPVTGRTHQLRLHFAYKGCAIYGDSLYGEAEESRQALHAYRIEFSRPSDGRRIKLESPVPNDMREILRQEKD